MALTFPNHPNQTVSAVRVQSHPLSRIPVFELRQFFTFCMGESAKSSLSITNMQIL